MIEIPSYLKKLKTPTIRLRRRIIQPKQTSKKKREHRKFERKNTSVITIAFFIKM